jgi:hypothetical protein
METLNGTMYGINKKGIDSMKKYTLLTVIILALTGCATEKNTTKAKAEAYKSKNLLRGSSFELERDNYDAINRLNWGNSGDPQKQPELNSACVRYGKYSLYFPELPERHTNSISFFPVKTTKGKKHTLSFWGKTTKGEIKGRLQLFDTNSYSKGPEGKKTFATVPFVIGPEWKRFSHEFTGNNFLFPVFMISRNENDGAVYIDAVQIEEGKLRDYTPCAQAEISVQMKKDGNIFLLGEKVEAELSVLDNRIAGKETEYEIDWKIQNHLKETMEEGSKKLDINPGEKKSFKIPCPSSRRGHFSIDAALTADGKKIESEVQFYAVFKKNEHDVSQSPFAMHNYFQNEKICPRTSKRSNIFGSGWARQHYWFTWDKIEKEEGKYTFNDILIDDLKKKNIKILATLGAWFSCMKGPDGPFRNVPKWAKTNDIQTQYGPYDKSKKGQLPHNTRYSMIPNLEMFSKYIYETVKHYKGYIKHWEIMNEPYIRSDAAAYGKILKAAYIAAKKADPDSVVLAQVSPDPKFLEELIKLGYAPYFDGVTTHYMRIDQEDEAAHLRKFRELMKKAGKGKDAVFWVSEGCRIVRSSYPFDDLYSQQESPISSAGKHVHHLVHCVAGGAGRKFFFCSPYNNGGRSRLHIENYNFTEFDNTPKPVMCALSFAGEFLTGAEYKENIKPLDSKLKIEAYIFKRGNEELAVLWAIPSSVKQYIVSLPENTKVKIYDFMGNQQESQGASFKIPGTAVYLEGKGLAEAIKNMTLVKTEMEDGLNLVMEAEHAQIVPPMKTMPEGALIDDNGLMWVEGPVGSPLLKEPPKETGWVDFVIDIPETRHYKIDFLVYFPNAGSNSLFVSLDGKGEQVLGESIYNKWVWLTKSFQLSKGPHTLRVRPRESRSRIDKIRVR